MLDALIHRQNGEITSPAEAAMIEERLQAPQRGRRAVRKREDAIQPVRSRQF